MTVPSISGSMRSLRSTRSTSVAIGSAAWVAPLGVLAGLSGIVLARWAATGAGLDPLAVGAAFGVALAALWVVAGVAFGRTQRILRVPKGRALGRRSAVAVAAGLAVGVALVGLAIVGASLAGLLLAPGTLRPAAPFLPWAAVTLLVAAAEEGILRGVLFDRLRAAGGATGGTILALALTSLAFALMHVPVYGWGVVPLDLAVGFALGGLRIGTRTLLAPIVAHAVADLATWWL